MDKILWEKMKLHEEEIDISLCRNRIKSWSVCFSDEEFHKERKREKNRLYSLIRMV